MNEEQSLHEQIDAVSRSLEQQVSAPAPNFDEPLSNKKRDSHHDTSKHDDNDSGEVDSNPKKMKRDSSLGYAFGNPTPEEMASLEALAQGSVPDMSTVASSIASLSAQPSPPGWAFMVPSTITTGASTSSIAQQQLYQQLLMQHQQAWYLQNMHREMQNQLRDEGGPTVGGMRFPLTERGTSSTPAANIFSSTEGTGMFMLLEQPNEVQRKSYKNENRCLLPNPLTICQKEFLPEDKRGQVPVDGSVTVSLVDQDGEELGPNKAHMLDSIERSTTQPLDENLSAQFSLKIMETSEGNMVRLLFTVRYRLKSLGQCEEKILSRPFVVYSNRKKHVKVSPDKEKPVLVDVKPQRGEFNRDTEVWIKGRGFSDKVAVTFGDKTAKVVDTSENLITVLAPQRDDITRDTTVDITVSNKFARELYSSEKKLSFTYSITPIEVRSALLPQSSLEAHVMDPIIEEKTVELQQPQ